MHPFALMLAIVLAVDGIRDSRPSIATLETAPAVERFELPGNGTRHFTMAIGRDDSIWLSSDANPGPGTLVRLGSNGRLIVFPSVPEVYHLGMAIGPDGALYLGTGGILRIDPLHYAMRSLNAGVEGLVTSGSDGHLWITHNTLAATLVSRVALDGSVAGTWRLDPGLIPGGVTLDGAFWLARSGQLVRIDASGAVKTSVGPLHYVQGFFVAGDVMWATSDKAVTLLDPDGVVRAHYRLPVSPGEIGGVWAATIDPEGNLWFSPSGEVWRITRAGKLTRFELPPLPESPCNQGYEGSQNLAFDSKGRLVVLEYSDGCGAFCFPGNPCAGAQAPPDVLTRVDPARLPAISEELLVSRRRAVR